MRFKTAKGEIAVNVPDRTSLEAVVREKLQQKQGFSLATLNLDHLVKMAKSAAYYKVYKAQDFVVADGNPIVWMSRMAAMPVKLMPGSEMVIPLARWAAEEDRRVALFGSSEDALSAAADDLKKHVPNLEVSCIIAPPFGFDVNSDAASHYLQQIEASGAGLCFVALGAPKQETFALHGREHAPSVGFASIGAGLDFLAGTQVRAPVWVQKIACEWLWRLMESPARMWRRYLSCFAILPQHILRSFALRWRA
ncbi:MAG: WecB/TagA/CpsF family glycosyltransferase [Cognatishimia sp.]